MGYTLRAGTSFCVVQDRLVFLDIEADRYFCLSGRAQALIEALRAGAELQAPAAMLLDALLRDGTLVRSDTDIAPTPCAARYTASDSLLDAPLPGVWPGAFARALGGVAVATLALRLGTLGSVLRGVERAKAKSAVDADEQADQVRAIAAAHHRTELVASPKGQCLPRSVALARHLLGAGLRVDLIIGVKLFPFEAHCWVQDRAFLVNDRIERVSAFTPILVI